MKYVLVFKIKHVFNVFLTFLIISSLSFGYYMYEESLVNETEIVMTFMIFRHGDRTPVENSLQYVTDKKKVLKLLRNSGYGQLTNPGKVRTYKVGEFIRRRYNGFLSSQYNMSETYLRSTDTTRTKMSMLAAMSATFPPEDSSCKGISPSWCEKINWNFAPYTTEPINYDFNLAVASCPKLIKGYKAAFDSPAPEMAKYFKFLDRWSKIINYNITQKPSMSYFIYDVYCAQISLGVPLGRKLEKIFPEIEETAGAGIDVVFGSEEHIVLGAGVLLNKFFEVANKIVSGEDVQKVHVYAGHDMNLYTFMGVTRITPRQGVPKYGALYALELRRVVATGEYIVVPVYLKTPDKDEVTYLQVDGCEGFCNLTTFHNLVSQYKRNISEWRIQCEWSREFDSDSIFFT